MVLDFNELVFLNMFKCLNLELLSFYLIININDFKKVIPVTYTACDSPSPQ